MIATVRLRRLGDSMVISIPKDIIKVFKMVEGESLLLSVEPNKPLIVYKEEHLRYD